MRTRLLIASVIVLAAVANAAAQNTQTIKPPANPAARAPSPQSFCMAEWKEMKAVGTLPPDAKWQDFNRECQKRSQAQAKPAARTWEVPSAVW